MSEQQQDVLVDAKSLMRQNYRDAAKELNKKVGELTHEETLNILQTIYNDQEQYKVLIKDIPWKEAFTSIFKREIASCAHNGYVLSYNGEETPQNTGESKNKPEAPLQVDNKLLMTAFKCENHMRKNQSGSCVGLVIFDEENFFITINKSAKTVSQIIEVEVEDVIAVDEEFGKENECVALCFDREQFNEKDQDKLIHQLMTEGVEVHLYCVVGWNEKGKAQVDMRVVDEMPDVEETSDEIKQDESEDQVSEEKSDEEKNNKLREDFKEQSDAMDKMEQAAEGEKQNVTVEESPKDFAKKEEMNVSFIETITDVKQTASVIKTLKSNNLKLIRKKTGHQCEIVDAEVDSVKDAGRLFYTIKTDNGRILFPYVDKTLKYFDVIDV